MEFTQQVGKRAVTDKTPIMDSVRVVTDIPQGTNVPSEVIRCAFHSADGATLPLQSDFLKAATSLAYALERKDVQISKVNIIDEGDMSVDKDSPVRFTVEVIVPTATSYDRSAFDTKPEHIANGEKAVDFLQEQIGKSAAAIEKSVATRSLL